MIKVDKDFDNVPTLLKKQNREDAFLENIAGGAYRDEKNRYKGSSIQKRLNKIYHLKCAYCEKKLLDSPKHIEHYRPKDIYYWLPYSWDNLLLSCGSCNSAKGIKFDIDGSRKSYGGETFKNIHTLGLSYDLEEKPKIINPEKEDILSEIVFNEKGEISSSNPRVDHTINDVCNLNRDELLKLRIKVLNNFKNKINKHYLLFIKKGDISRFIPDIEVFVKECTKENEFYAFRYFILSNIEIFFKEKTVCKILENLIPKYI